MFVAATGFLGLAALVIACVAPRHRTTAGASALGFALAHGLVADLDAAGLAALFALTAPRLGQRVARWRPALGRDLGRLVHLAPWMAALHLARSHHYVLASAVLAGGILTLRRARKWLG